MTRRTQKLLVSLATLVFVVLVRQYSAPAPTIAAPQTPPIPVSEVPAGFVAVFDVIDGDTIDVNLNGAKQRVRLIGINTPETVDPRKPVQCFGKEASSHAKQTLLGKAVRLEADPTQDDTDKYGRILRYVFLEDGTNFNQQMIADGFAYEYTYSKAYRYQKDFRAAQKDAQANKRGLWSPQTCAGQK